MARSRHTWTYLKEHGQEVINPALPDEDFDEFLRIAQAEFDQNEPDVIVGSSRGGAVAMNIDSKDSALPPETLIEIGNDHRLADEEPLEACEQLKG